MIKHIFIIVYLVFIFLFSVSTYSVEPVLTNIWSFPKESADQKGKEDEIFLYAPEIDEQSGFLFLASNKYCYKLNIQTGELIAQVKLPNPPSAEPVYLQGNLFIATLNGRLISYSSDLNAKPLISKPVKNEKIIFLTPLNTGLLLTFESGRHSLYDYKNDKILWETANKNKTGQPPAYDAATGTIYTTDSEKNLYIISEKTGRNEILTALPEKGSNPPYFYKERIYIGIESGKFIAIDSSDGDIDWEFETINNTVSQAVGYENMICFSALNNQIYCLNRRTGTIEFRIPGKNRFYLPPVITDDILFGFPFNEGVISFNLDEEKPIGLTKLTDQILTPVKVSQSKTLLFILNNSGILKTYNYSQIVTLSNTID